MPKSSRRDKTEGLVDRTVGRVLEGISKLTGNRKGRATGKTARARGRGRTAKGRTKARARR